MKQLFRACYDAILAVLRGRGPQAVVFGGGLWYSGDYLPITKALTPIAVVRLAGDNHVQVVVNNGLLDAETSASMDKEFREAARLLEVTMVPPIVP